MKESLMYDQDVVAEAGSKLTLNTPAGSRTVDLYSAEGRDLLASLWLKVSAEHRLMYEPTWMGIPIIQLPEDIVMMQELVWKVQPDLIVECGIAHGGALIQYAAICELLGKGRVLGVDVEIRKHNRLAIENHPMSKRIELLEGSSIDPATVAAVHKKAAGARKVLVILDSNHTYKHVLAELEAYHDLVTPGSYLVCMDGAQAHVWDIPRGKKEWRDDHPLKSLREFLKTHPEFRTDPHYTRLKVTASPEGWLKRLSPEEMK